jgi:hypothetical protein
LKWHGCFLLLAGLLTIRTAHAGYGFEDLERLLKSRPFSGVDEVLPELPKELWDNFALVYRRGATQEGNLTHPRVLLASDDGKLILTFTDASLQNGTHLEALTFSDHQFKLWDIDFAADPVTGKIVANLVEDPKDCTGCHGDRPVPIWGSPPMFRGVLGSYRDLFSPVENSWLRSFEKRAAIHPRYRHLNLKPLKARGSINQKLAGQFIKLNSDRLLHLSKQSPQFARWRPLLAWLQLGCRSPNPALDGAIMEQLLGNLKKEFLGKFSSWSKPPIIDPSGRLVFVRDWTLKITGHNLEDFGKALEQDENTRLALNEPELMIVKLLGIERKDVRMRANMGMDGIYAQEIGFEFNYRSGGIQLLDQFRFDSWMDLVASDARYGAILAPARLAGVGAEDFKARFSKSEPREFVRLCNELARNAGAGGKPL